jgi:hypothetical protein
VQALTHSRLEFDPDTGQISRSPLHDEASKWSDALHYVAVAMQGARQAVCKKPDAPLRFYNPK